MIFVGKSSLCMIHFNTSEEVEKMKKTLCIGLVTVMIMAFSTVVFGEGTGEGIKFGLVVTSTLGDKAMADMTWAGLNQLKEEYPDIEIKVYESPNRATDWEPNLIAASTDNDFVFVTASSMGDILGEKIAPAYPDTKYVSIDYYLDGFDNVACCSFACNEVSFLLGSIAGLMTENTDIPGINSEKIVAWISGMEAPVNIDYYTGCKAGVEYTCPDATVLQSWTGTYKDPLLAKEMTKALISQGADVICPVLSSAAVGCHEACRDEGVYSFFLDIDSDDVYPGTVVTTGLKNSNVITYNYGKDYIEGKFSPEFSLLGLESGGMDITDMHVIKETLGDDFPQEIIDKAQEIRQDIIDGNIHVPFNPEARPADFEG